MSEEHGKSVQEWVNQGIQQREAGDHESALISFTKVLELEPNHVETRYKQAETFSHLNRIEEAITAYQSCYQSATEAKNSWYQAAAQYSLGVRYKSLQKSTESAQAYAQAYRLFRQIKDKKWTEAAWKELTEFTDNYIAVNQYAEAIPFYQIQRDILQEFNDQKVLCSVLENLGKAQYYQKDYQSAIESHTLMLEIARFVQNKVKESLALGWLGCDRWQANQLDFDFALHYFQQRLTLAKNENDSAVQKETLGWLVSVCKQLGKDTAMPCPYMMEQIELFRQLGETDKERSSCYELGSWQFDLKQYQEAVESLALAANLGEAINKANAYFMLGQCYRMLEQQAEALKNYQKAADLYIQHDNQEWAEKALDYLGQIYKSLKEYEKAIEAQQQRLKLVQVIGDNRFNEFAINYELGCLYNNKQKYSSAIEYLTSALALANELQQKGNAANAHYMLGSVHEKLEQLDKCEIGQPLEAESLYNLNEALDNYYQAETFYRETENKQYCNKSSHHLKEVRARIEKVFFPKSVQKPSNTFLRDDLHFLSEILDNIAQQATPSKHLIEDFIKANVEKLETIYPDNIEYLVWKLLEMSKTEKGKTEIFQSFLLFSGVLEEFPIRNSSHIEVSIAFYQGILKGINPSLYRDMFGGVQLALATAYFLRKKGNKAKNLEISIFYYKTVEMLKYMHELFPEDWATNQWLFGCAYRERVQGNKKINIERSITYFNNALEILTPLNFPEKWAAVHNALGCSYLNKTIGEKYKNQEIAIKHYNTALQFRTRIEHPKHWAETQRNLGNTYINRIIGEKSNNQEIAISYYQSSLEVYTRPDFPNEWAATQKELSHAYIDRIQGQKTDNLESAIAGYKSALEVYTRPDFPKWWAEIQLNLANAYIQRILGDKLDNIDVAIFYYKAALEVYNCKDFTNEWIATQISLATAYTNRIDEEKADNLESAIAGYKAVLKICNTTEFPNEWALVQNNLGAVYFKRIRGRKVENLEQSIAYCTAALDIYTPEADPESWAMVQINLANTYTERILGEKAENLEQAIDYCNSALKVYSKQRFPQQWGIVQHTLGNAYSKRVLGEKIQNLEFAIVYYTAALEVRSTVDCSELWAGTQTNLANLYKNRIFGEKGDNLERAISCCFNALKVYSQEKFPQDWATAQNILGCIYTERILGDKSENWEKAIECYASVLTVCTRDSFPENWANTQHYLGNAYRKRSKGNKVENLKKGSVCYEAALGFYTRELFPEKYMIVLYNLGLIYQESGQLQLAYNTFTDAIETLEFLLGEIQFGDEAKRKIGEEGNRLFCSMIEVCIEVKNYTIAIEYADRSKTRNLIELLATRDLYPKGNIPETILNNLERLRREITIEQRQIETIERNRTFSGMFITEGFGTQKDATPLRTDRTRLNQLRQEIDELIKHDIAPHDSNFALTQKVKPISFSDIQRLVSDGKTALIEWYIYSCEKFIAFIVTPQHPIPTIWQSSNEDFQRLGNWLLNYVNSYNSNKQQWRDELEEKLSELARILHLDELLAPIPNECEKLILIPHLFLHLFPLHSLEGVRPQKSGDRSQKLPLIDLFPGGVSYAPSCQLLQITSRNARSNGELQHLVAIQNPTDDLTFTDIEVETIRRYFDSAHILAKQDATKEALQQKITQTRTLHYLHFSCHGYFSLKLPMLSALLLAGCQIEVSKQPLESKLNQYVILPDNTALDLTKCLTLGELFDRSFDVRHCRLVTLSACETGLSDFSSLSDEYISLPSGFIYAGVPSVVCTLWTVNELSTAFFMDKFYENLKKTMPVPVALKEAQFSLRNLTVAQLEQWLETAALLLTPTQEVELCVWLSKMDPTDTPFASPYYWAAFCAVGQ
ncbi:CHAT domain-containing protein [Laspinema olomoucense]|uniref:CHAT domain-containing protein n=1 Tax=Laspinema olomoucense TaxID=3231600 RepID=UPI0021BB7208|nr:CHAT domain-containing protein [Laspinema sp. D3d]MCT7973416.1 CHAT domain-containing protein [Laspinema sp. D3d]